MTKKTVIITNQFIGYLWLTCYDDEGMAYKRACYVKCNQICVHSFPLDQVVALKRAGVKNPGMATCYWFYC